MRPKARDYEEYRRFDDIQQVDPLKEQILAGDRGMAILLLSRLYGRAAELMTATDPAQAEQFGWLKHACEAHICRPITGSGQKGFLLRNELKREDFAEHWRQIPIAANVLLWGQAQIEKNPQLKLHLLAALWESKAFWTKEKVLDLGVPQLVQSIVDTSIAAINVEIAADDAFAARGHHVATYLEVAAFVSSRLKLFGALSPVVPVLLSFAKALKSSPAPHWANTICEVCAWIAVQQVKTGSTAIFSAAQLEELLGIAQGVLERFETEPGAPSLEEAFKVVLTLENLITKVEVSDSEYFRRLGDSHRRKAEKSRFPGYISGSFYLDAAVAYTQAGQKQDAAEMKAASRKAVGDSIANNEMKRLQHRESVSVERMKEILFPFFAEAECAIDVLGRLGQRLFVHSIEFGESSGPKSVLAHLLPIQPIVDDRLKAPQASGAGGGTYHQKQTWMLEITIANQLVLGPAIERLKAEYSLTDQDILASISQSPFWEAQDRPFLKRCAERFVDEDYYSFVHLIVPRLEQLIRRILLKLGLDATALKDGELRERTLGELLREAQNKRCFPHGLVEVTQAILSEEWGLNLRNRVAHGLAYPGECNYLNACRTLHLAILLSSLCEIECTSDT